MTAPWTKPRPEQHSFVNTGTVFSTQLTCEHCGWNAEREEASECLPVGIEVSRLLPEPLSAESRYVILVEKAKRWIKKSRRD